MSNSDQANVFSKKKSWKNLRELKYNNIDKKVTKILLEGEDKCIPKVQE